MLRRPRPNSLGLIVSVVLALLFSCAALAQTPVTVTIGIKIRDEYIPAYEELLRRFEAQNPLIRTEMILLDNLDEKINLMYVSGQMPDVWGEGGITATWNMRGMFLDLTPYVERSAEELNIGDFLPAAWNNVVRQGKIIGLPWNLFTSAYGYNRTHFAESALAEPPVDWTDPNWTYERAFDYGRKLTKRTPDDRVIHYGFDAWLWEDYLVAWAQAFGGDFFDRESYDTGIVQGITIASDQTKRAFQTLIDLMYHDRIMPNPVDSVWASEPTFWEPFGSGHISSRITSGWIWQGYIDAGLDNWGLAAIPQFPVGRHNLVFNDAFHIYSGTTVPDAAWELVKFLTSTESMEYFASQTKAGPARFSAMGPYAEYLAAGLQMSVADVVTMITGSQVDASEAMDHDLYGWNDLRQVAIDGLAAAWRNEMPMDVALDETQRKMQVMADELRNSLSQ